MNPVDRLHSWYLYTARLKDSTEAQRNMLLDELKKKDIGAEAYYVNPVHLMPFYRENYPILTLPETDRASRQVFSLPIHPAVTPTRYSLHRRDSTWPPLAGYLLVYESARVKLHFHTILSDSQNS